MVKIKKLEKILNQTIKELDNQLKMNLKNLIFVSRNQIYTLSLYPIAFLIVALNLFRRKKFQKFKIKTICGKHLYRWNWKTSLSIKINKTQEKI